MKRFGNCLPAGKAGKLKIGYSRQRRAGFTFLELLIVMGLAGVVATMGVVAFGQVRRQEELLAVTGNIVNVLVQARVKSIAGEGDKAWKVVMGSNQVTLQDEEGKSVDQYQLPTKYILTGPVSEVQFNRVDGRVVICESGCGFVVSEVSGNLNRGIEVLYSGGIEY